MLAKQTNAASGSATTTHRVHAGSDASSKATTKTGQKGDQLPYMS
jgi:hypothetical protein